MADLGQVFDSSTVAPREGPPPPVPTDWYNVMITDTEVKKTKDGTGAFLEVVLKVLDGPHAGRMGWDRLNLWNKNPVAVEMAQGSLSAICHATQVFQVQDTSALHGKPLMAKFVFKEASGGYDASNDIKGYAATGAKQPMNQDGAAADIAPTAPFAGNVSGTPTTAPSTAGGPEFTPPWGAAGGPPAVEAPVAPAPPVAPEVPAGFAPAVVEAPVAAVTPVEAPDPAIVPVVPTPEAPVAQVPTPQVPAPAAPAAPEAPAAPAEGAVMPPWMAK